MGSEASCAGLLSHPPHSPGASSLATKTQQFAGADGEFGRALPGSSAKSYLAPTLLIDWGADSSETIWPGADGKQTNAGAHPPLA